MLSASEIPNVLDLIRQQERERTVEEFRMYVMERCTLRVTPLYPRQVESAVYSMLDDFNRRSA